MDCAKMYAPLMLDVNGGFPAVRPVTEEDGTRDWVFELSSAGIVQIWQSVDLVLYVENASCADSRLKLARLKLYLVDIGRGQYSEVPLDIVEKVRYLVTDIFSKIKLEKYDFIDLIGFSKGSLKKSTVFAYIGILFDDLKVALEQEDRLGEMRCVERLIEIVDIVNKSISNNGFSVDEELEKGGVWLQRVADVQKIASFVKRAVAQINLDDIKSHNLGKKIEKVYSFIERCFPQDCVFFYDCLGERFSFFINDVSVCRDKFKFLGNIIKSLEIWRDFGSNPLLRLDDNFNRFFDGFVKQARQHLLKDVLSFPLEERSFILRFLRKTGQVKEEDFIEEFVKQDPSLLASYMTSMEIEVQELLTNPFCFGRSFILSKSQKIVEILREAESLQDAIVKNSFLYNVFISINLRRIFFDAACFVIQNYLFYQTDVNEILAMFYCIEKLFPFNCPLQLTSRDLERFYVLLESSAPCYNDLGACIQDLPLVDWQKAQLIQMRENAADKT